MLYVNKTNNKSYLNELVSFDIDIQTSCPILTYSTNNYFLSVCRDYMN